MYILTASGEGIVDFDKYARVFTAYRDDAILVSVGSFNNELPVTLGRYPSIAQARDAIRELAERLAAGDAVFQMPEGLQEMPFKIHDSRVKRKGGS